MKEIKPKFAVKLKCKTSFNLKTKSYKITHKLKANLQLVLIFSSKLNIVRSDNEIY
jgi:hypothetical protein